jgi:hypothetical protein
MLIWNDDEPRFSSSDISNALGMCIVMLSPNAVNIPTPFTRPAPSMAFRAISPSTLSSVFPCFCRFSVSCVQALDFPRCFSRFLTFFLFLRPWIRLFFQLYILALHFLLSISSSIRCSPFPLCFLYSVIAVIPISITDTIISIISIHHNTTFAFLRRHRRGHTGLPPGSRFSGGEEEIGGRRGEIEEKRNNI